MRLSDDDLGAMLVCIDAVHTLNQLKLAHCVNVVGHGLEPIRGSTVLRQIDLYLVGRFESPKIRGEVLLSETAVIPILESILDTEGSSLTDVMFPRKWSGQSRRREWSQGVLRFFDNINQHMRNRSLQCSIEDCGQVITGPDNCVCYDCGKIVCQECYEGGGDVIISYCSKCEKMCCEKCVPSGWCETWNCSNSGEQFCSGCLPTMHCKECDFV